MGVEIVTVASMFLFVCTLREDDLCVDASSADDALLFSEGSILNERGK